MAKKVDQSDSKKFKNIKFTKDEIQQINYAALLHDFGKIGVRENILVKAKKLFPFELEAIKSRFKIFRQEMELNYSREKIELLLNEERTKAADKFEKLDQKTKDKLNELDEYLNFVIDVNEPTVMKQANFDLLLQISKIVCEDEGQMTKLLSENEIERLSIPKGSLSSEERLEIESHVTHTFNFLNKIPWTKELKKIPQIAHAHHEKLDGKGYPLGISEQEIPIQSKMMAIADIYDALTAWDRPYKKAVSVNKALDILQWEVNDGKVDGDLFNLFLQAKLFTLVKKPEDM